MAAVCGTASSANATIQRCLRRVTAVVGLAAHDYGKYAAILHLAVLIGMAFAQVHRLLGPAACRTHDPLRYLVLGHEVAKS